MADSRELVTTASVERSVLNRIRLGRYRPGERLPSVRDLARELGSNRNTVNKAYQNLIGLGVITAGGSSREGFRVGGLAGALAESAPPFAEHLYRRVTQLVWEGMAAGIGADEMLELSSRAVREVFREGAVRLAFYECNALDSREMGAHLSRALGLELTCGVLSDLGRHAAQLTRDYDLIVTTFHHVAEAVQVAGTDKNKVVGIDTRLTPETLLEVAHLPNTRVGVVCELGTTAHMLEHVLHGYYPVLTLEAVTLADPAGVQRVARENDHIIATRTCAAETERLVGRPVDVVVNFQIDEQSLSYLRQKIGRVQADKLARSSFEAAYAPGLGEA